MRNKLLKDFNLKGSDYLIELKAVEESHEPDPSRMTVVYPANYILEVHKDGESIKLPVTLARVPHLLHDGYKIKGTYYSGTNILKRAPGWFLVKKSKEQFPTMEYCPRGGVKIAMSYNGVMEVGFKGNNSSRNIPLAVFLKAISGMSYDELILKLGIKNMVVLSSFIDEPSMEDCIKITLSSLYGGVGNYTSFYLKKELMNRLFGHERAEDEVRRLKNTASFKNRLSSVDAKPVKDILVDGKVICQRDKVLTSTMLEEIDNSNLESLVIRIKGNVYDYRKYDFENDSLSLGSILTAVNLFATALEVNTPADNPYDVENKRMAPIDSFIMEAIEDNANFVMYSALSSLITSSVTNVSIPEMLDKKRDVIIDTMCNPKDAQISTGMDNTNTVSTYTLFHKAMSDIKGTITSDMTTVKATEIGRSDTFHAPESIKAGLSLFLTLNCEVTEDGRILVPYIVYKDKIKQNNGKPVFLEASEVSGKYIASWEADVENDDVVDCRFGERFVKVSSSSVELQDFSPCNNLSLATSLLSFLQNAAGKRIVMGGGQTKQSVQTLMSEPPYVSSGIVGMYGVGVITASELIEEFFVTSGMDFTDEELLHAKKDGIISVYDMTPKGDYKEIFFDLEVDDKVTRFSKIIPFRLKSSTGTIIRTMINSIEGTMVFNDNDIVFHNSDIDVSCTNVDIHMNLGHQTDLDLDNIELNRSHINVDQRLGYNYRVGFIPYSSTTMDDSITIRQSLVGAGMLTHFKIIEKTHILSESKDLTEELTPYGIHCTKIGVPEIGTYLTPRSKYISKTSKNLSGVIKDSSLYLDAITEGMVIATKVIDKEVSITLLRECYPELADKMAGCHGNKGVIANIVPDKDMPFDEDGVPVDICLNPLGLPSRMNISQLLEAVLGMALNRKSKEVGEFCRVVISPQNPESLDIVKNYKETYNVTPVQLRDGATGIPFDRETFVGYLYLRKLTHDVRSKYNATGLAESTNVATRQPGKGKKVEGGQSLGEMELHTLINAGCVNLKHFLTSVQSSDISARKHLEGYMRSLGTKFAEEYIIQNNDMISQFQRDIAPPVGTNHNDRTVRALLFSMGVMMDVEGDHNTMRPITSEDIRRLAVKPMAPDKANLTSPHFFGPMDAKSIIKSMDRWQYIDTNCEYIHPLHIYKSKIPSLLIINVFGKSGKLKEESCNSAKIRDIIAGNSYVAIANSNEVIVSSNIKDNPEYQWITGMKAVTEMFKYCKAEDSMRFYNAKMARAQTEEKASSYIELIRMSEDIIARGGFSTYILDCFPIMPLYLRVEQDGRTSDFNHYYANLFPAAKAGNADKVYRNILEFTGLSPNEFYSDKDSSFRTLSQFFFGKDLQSSKGFQTEKMMANVIMCSGRTVITSANVEELEITEIGIPFKAAVTCLYPCILSILESFTELDGVDKKEFINSLIDEDLVKMHQILSMSVSDVEEFHNRVKSYLIQFIEQFYVVAGRQPTLHKYGIRGFKAKVFDGLTLRLHPLICNGFNADFDGDQMWFAFALTEECAREARENLSPLYDIVTSKDKDYIINPSQDILLGMYLSTMLHKNITDIRESSVYDVSNLRIYNDLDLITRDIEMGVLKTYDPVMYTHTNGNRYLSTAGIIEFNGLIPGCFLDDTFENHFGFKCDESNYNELRFDGLVKKNISKHPVLNNGAQYMEIGQSSINDYIFNTVGESKMVLIFNEMAKVYCRRCSKSGITLFVDDFVQHPEAEELIAKAESQVAKLNTYYDLGYMTESSKLSASTKIYKYITDKVKKELISFYNRNNNLFIILDSGARGNLGQLNQTCGIIGMVSKSATEMMETPVLGNYIKGLSSSESLIMTYGTRTSIFQVQAGTADAGEFTKILVYLLSNFKIVENDCGSGLCDYGLLYTDDCEQTDVLVGKTLSTSDEHYRLFAEMLEDSKGVITTEIESSIKRHRLNEVHLDDGSVVKLKYKLSKFTKSNLLDRESENLPYLTKAGYITNKTIEYLEENNIKTIKARTMFTCNSVGGVCSKCYGLHDSNKKLPPVGTNIGINTAQSIGEPGTQLSMDAINKGGNIEDVNTNILSFLKTIIKSSEINSMTALVAPFDLNADIISVGKDSAIKFSEYESAPRDSFIVSNKEFVYAGSPVTVGVTNPNSIDLGDKDKTVVARTKSLATTLQGFFEKSNLDICARNFEIVARAKCSIVKITNSTDPNFQVGKMYFYSELPKDKSDLSFKFGSFSSRDVILMYSGFETLLTGGNAAANIGAIANNPDLRISVPGSPLGALYNGHGLDGKPKPIRGLYKRDNFDDTEMASTSDEVVEIDYGVVSKAFESIEIGDELDNIDEFNFDDLEDLEIEDTEDVNDKHDTMDKSTMDRVEF